MDSLDRFSNRYVIEGTIELKTPMRIGGGQNAALYSLSPSPVIECYDAGSGIFEPYIPGSSLKGVLRNTVERLYRTFDPAGCCVSVGDRKEAGSVLCGDEQCISCRLFGSQKGGARVRVRSAFLTDECRAMADRQGYIRDRPHFGNPKPFGKGMMRPEESVSAGTSFRFHIDLDNGTDAEAGLIMLALFEFRENRVHLGGSSTRGHGFCTIPSGSIHRTTWVDGQLIKEKRPFKECTAAARSLLSSARRSSDDGARTFDRYYMAGSSPSGEFDDGHYVAKLTVRCITPFSMKGLEEATVTNGLNPVIPGSTIKGFFRHSLRKHEADPSIVDSIFGSLKHRGRLIVSDAWPRGKGGIGDEEIPRNTDLEMVMVFDNMTGEEMQYITNFFDKEIQITGNTSAGVTRNSRSDPKNLVRISVKELHRFSADDYLAG